MHRTDNPIYKGVKPLSAKYDNAAITFPRRPLIGQVPCSYYSGLAMRGGLGFRNSPKPLNPTVNPIKLETGLRPNSAEIPYTLLLKIEAMGFPTFGLLL